jgi:hypothetical protein
MRWRGSFRWLAAVALLWGCAEGTPPSPAVADPRPEPASPREEPTPPDDPAPPREPTPPAGATCLAEVYPDAIADVVRRSDEWTVVFADDREAPWDDGREKDQETRLREPDLEDTLAQVYPRGAPPSQPAADFEPGRVRHPMLLENAYGESERAVRAQLVSIRWPTGGSVRVSSHEGAADALRAVIAEVPGLPAAARRCVEPPIGSFFHRTIRGTDRLSPHAFGIAIDLNSECGEYWRWQRPFEGRWRNRMPQAVVDLFESHDFAWGGRWYHYDTFHFEYRPELFRCR